MPQLKIQQLITTLLKCHLFDCSAAILKTPLTFSLCQVSLSNTLNPEFLLMGVYGGGCKLSTRDVKHVKKLWEIKSLLKEIFADFQPALSHYNVDNKGKLTMFNFSPCCLHPERPAHPKHIIWRYLCSRL